MSYDDTLSDDEETNINNDIETGQIVQYKPFSNYKNIIRQRRTYCISTLMKCIILVICGLELITIIFVLGSYNGLYEMPYNFAIPYNKF